MKNYSIIFFFNIFLFISHSISAENDIYKKIDLFGEVLEKIISNEKFNSHQRSNK